LTRIHGAGSNGSIKLHGPRSRSSRRHFFRGIFIAAASLFPESSILIQNVGLNPTRTAILDVLAQMGASIQIHSVQSSHGEVIGDLAVKGAALKGGLVSGDTIPLVIDELPMLAALGPYTEQGIEIRDAGELRVKGERSHCRACREFAQDGRDGRRAARWVESCWVLRGKLRGAEIEPHGDHRIADGVAIAGLAAESPTTIRDAECAGVSFPVVLRRVESHCRTVRFQ